ncbi:hypothetical protein J4218_01225 [Candidatus Pacearchaeota archaeon]|nr:hypothetical protein [Candidatus Pacearchaeota archaeon]
MSEISSFVRGGLCGAGLLLTFLAAVNYYEPPRTRVNPSISYAPVVSSCLDSRVVQASSGTLEAPKTESQRPVYGIDLHIDFIMKAKNF